MFLNFEIKLFYSCVEGGGLQTISYFLFNFQKNGNLTSCKRECCDARHGLPAIIPRIFYPYPKELVAPQKSQESIGQMEYSQK